MVKEAIIEKIEEYETIIIHRHVRPDSDALGSQCGLREIIRSTYPTKNVYAVGEENESFYYLARMDEVDDNAFQEALIIICDTANTERISDSRYINGKEVIKIDHHPNNDPYGDLLWVDTDSSSTSEMIYDLYLHAKEKGWQMNEKAARLIYAGIIGDTGRFLYPSTTNRTFHYASELIEYPFDRTALYQDMYNVKQNIARLRGYILQNFTISPSGVSSIKLTKETLDSFGVDPIDTGKLVGTLGEIEGIRAWIMFIEEKETIRARIRSKGPVINELAGKYRGGGHPLAAGASVSSWEEADRFIADLEELCAIYVAE